MTRSRKAKPKAFEIRTDGIHREIGNYTIGFARLTVRDNVEDATCAGSGTLVSVGSLYGVLTAAHVVHAWLKDHEIGIVTLVDDPSQFRKQTIQMTHADWLTIGGQKNDGTGPDIAFLRLPLENVESLKATHSFYNLSKHRDDALAHKWVGNGHVDFVVGMIGELTKEIPADRPKVRKVQFSSILCGGALTLMRDVGGFDLFDFKPSGDLGRPMPDSFEGVSGGAIWRYYVTIKNGNPEVVDRRVIGVPFYQWFSTRTIRYHGPVSIYGRLFDQIVAKWPNEAK